MSCIDRDTAISLARNRVDQLAQSVGDQFEILSDSTRELEQGWVFFFNTVDFARAQDQSAALAGNSPIFVTRDGVVYELPSAIPWAAAVESVCRGASVQLA